MEPARSLTCVWVHEKAGVRTRVGLGVGLGVWVRGCGSGVRSKREKEWGGERWRDFIGDWGLIFVSPVRKREKNEEREAEVEIGRESERVSERVRE